MQRAREMKEGKGKKVKRKGRGVVNKGGEEKRREE